MTNSEAGGLPYLRQPRDADRRAPGVVAGVEDDGKAGAVAHEKDDDRK
jgi:hypothetical protein